MEIFILLVLIFFNALFVMSEIALISARKSKLELQADRGDTQAKKAFELASNPEIFLPAAQIGITLISIITGVYSGERFGKDLAPLLARFGSLTPYAEAISTTIIVVVVTFVSIVFGELIPKRIGLMRSEKIAKRVAGPMVFFAKLFYPMVWLLNKVSSMFYRILNIQKSNEEAVTEEEIKSLIGEGAEAGTIDEAEQQIIERIFHLGDRNITSLMTHRSDIVWFNVDDTEEQIKQKILQEPHSTYPICDGGIDKIVGVISIKDLYIHGNNISFRSYMKNVLIVPENNTAYQVLEKFKESHLHTCFIVDEYGSVLGLITLNDILEAIIGDMPQPDVPDYEIKEREDGSYLVDAQIPFYDFLSKFDKEEWMNEGEQEFDTLAGLILHKLERIPVTSDKFDWNGFDFEILDMDGHRIDKVLVVISQTIRDEMDEE